MINEAKITIITPTTGKNSLNRLINSINRQNIKFVHILLWDEKRDGNICPKSLDYNENGCIRYSIEIPHKMIQGVACGSALRAVGMMAANTPYVTFADDDVWYDDDHLESLYNAVNNENKEWGYCIRRVWNEINEDIICIGEDRFESIGEDTTLPYQLIDNNSLIVSRRLASSAACLYRETQQYDDDRRMFAFLSKYGGIPAKTMKVTNNQICPTRLKEMFNNLCTKCEQSGKKIEELYGYLG